MKQQKQAVRDVRNDTTSPVNLWFDNIAMLINWFWDVEKGQDTGHIEKQR